MEPINKIVLSADTLAGIAIDHGSLLPYIKRRCPDAPIIRRWSNSPSRWHPKTIIRTHVDKKTCALHIEWTPVPLTEQQNTAREFARNVQKTQNAAITNIMNNSFIKDTPDEHDD